MPPASPWEQGTAEARRGLGRRLTLPQWKNPGFNARIFCETIPQCCGPQLGVILLPGDIWQWLQTSVVSRRLSASLLQCTGQPPPQNDLALKCQQCQGWETVLTLKRKCKQLRQGTGQAFHEINGHTTEPGCAEHARRSWPFPSEPRAPLGNGSIQPPSNLLGTVPISTEPT